MRKLRNLRFVWLAMTVLVVATLACGGEKTLTPEKTSTPAPSPTREEAQPPQPTPVPTQEMPSLEITNNSGTDVVYVYLSPSQADRWGEDWLQGHVIHHGETYTIAEIPAGTYDVKAEDENQEVIETWWNVEFDGKMMWTILGVASLEVINDSPDTITDLYISPTEDETWGETWLSADVIDPGETYVVGSIPRGTYDIKATDAAGDSIEMIFNVSVAGQKTWNVVGRALLPDNAVLRFEEQFEDNRNNWGLDVEDEDVFYRRPANGEYCILIKSDQFTAWEWYEPFRTDEFVAEVSCRTEGPEDATCGLGFGPDGDNLYWFEVSASNQTFALFLLEDGAWQDPLIEWTPSVNISPVGPNTLSLERVGGVVSVFANGVLVGQVDSDRFPTGRVGIGGSTYNQGNATVCLDDLRVWRLE